ncbi:unnamed protein product, partial [Mesorhabditis spiculigera]
MNTASVYASPYEPNPELFLTDDSEAVLDASSRSRASSSPEANSAHDSASMSPEGAVKDESVVLEDDEPVYANLAEMPARPMGFLPDTPKPGPCDQLRRVLLNGWAEYMSEGGRPYFFNAETAQCQWCPPRLMRSPSEVKAFLDATKHLDDALPKCSIDESFDSVASDTDFEEVSPLDARGALEESIIKGASDQEDVVEVARKDSGEIKHMLLHNPNFTDGRPPSFVTRNRGSLKQVFPPEVPSAKISIPSTSGTADYDTPSSSYPPRDDALANIDVPRPVRQGSMERMVSEKARKREWASCYFFLSTAHLLVYKDQRSAEKQGKHYDAPLLAIDLRGASISWVVEREKRKRRVFQLVLPPWIPALSNPSPLLLRSQSDVLTEQWFDAIRQVIAHLPTIDAASGPSTMVLPTSVIKNPSASLMQRPHSTYNVSTKKRDPRMDPMSASAYEAPPSSLAPPPPTSNDPAPSKQTIINKLLKFLRSRPTVESLKEKGIYKPEPVFGSTLSAICQLENSLVPRFIQVVIELIESKGLEVDGLYRVSGNLSSVQKIRCHVDQNRYQALVAEDDIHVLTGALKLFFRELAEPVFPTKMSKEFIATMQLATTPQKLKRLNELLKQLPPENRETLKMLLRHLCLVDKHSAENRMQIHNLALMFGPTLFQTGDERPAAGSKDKKPKDKKKKGKEEPPPPAASNSHLAFRMIMQGRIVEFLLKEGSALESLQGPVKLQP